jgi:Protein of unknown function (DUF2975)
MSHVISSGDGSRLMGSAARPDLRGRIGWICHGVRFAALLWIAWILVVVVITWSDRAPVLQAYGQWLGMDLTGVSASRYATAFGLVLADLAVAAAVAFCIWRLFGTYLSGRVFTIDAALWLRRTGAAAIAAVIIDVLLRFLIMSLLAGQFIFVPARGFLLLPQDLLHLIFGLFLLALAHIFKAAAEMAEDHAQIV